LGAQRKVPTGSGLDEVKLSKRFVEKIIIAGRSITGNEIACQKKPPCFGIQEAHISISFAVTQRP
jgi:hypothetical protein